MYVLSSQHSWDIIRYLASGVDTMTLLKAVELLENGDWEGAHSIAQKDDSELGSWAHGIVHLMEGDVSNAGYWYKRAGREPAEPVNIAQEIIALKDRVNQHIAKSSP